MYSTTTSATSFLLQSDGFIAGTLYGKFPDRYDIEGGTVATAQTTPIYGGIPIALTVVAPNASGGSSGLGETAIAATAETNIDGWAVFDQASAGVISASSNVPLYFANSSFNFVRAGSGAYVVLPVNPAVVNTIAGGASNQTLYWDFTNNRVNTTGTGALGFQVVGLNSNSKTVTYVAGPPIKANWTGGGSVIIVRV